MNELGPEDFQRDLLRWSETLASIARTGMGFTQSLYERERYEEVLHVASDIKAASEEAIEVRREQDHFVQEWMENIGEGVPGYVTPKVAVGAIVGNDNGEILLMKRADSGIWLYPTGWADVGYSPAEVAMKEVEEETGVTNLKITHKLQKTYHVFKRGGKYKLKVTHWYEMRTDFTGTPKPQANEGIEKVAWLNPEEIKEALKNSYENIKLLFQEEELLR